MIYRAAPYMLQSSNNPDQDFAKNYFIIKKNLAYKKTFWQKTPYPTLTEIGYVGKESEEIIILLQRSHSPCVSSLSLFEK